MWKAQAPSNIALIKYMGKKDATINLPLNPSLSYTLKNFYTKVTLEQIEAKDDIWEPLNTKDNVILSLAQSQIDRFLNHLKRMKQIFAVSGNFKVCSANNFPKGIGLASSASSFAALTKCALTAFAELTQKPPLSINQQANIARLASGSSCRSFYAPWCLWDEDRVMRVPTHYKELLHYPVIFTNSEKKISSSNAHLMIQTSPNFTGRQARATQRLQKLLPALQKGAWQEIYQICRAEFLDMHNLFATSNPPFSYITPSCNELLQQIDAEWRITKDGPIVTMDAGSTVHLLFRQDQAKILNRYKSEYK